MVTRFSRSPRPRGGYILLVTLVTCFLVLFLMVYAGLQGSHFQLARTLESQNLNHDAIQALQASALDRLMYDPSWREGYSYRHYDHPSVNASMTFDPSKPEWSLNNHAAEAPAASFDGRAVPPGFVHLAVSSLSPDTTPLNALDDSLSVKSSHQAMVNVYRQYFLEDFRDNGVIGDASNTWTVTPPDARQIVGAYFYLGTPQRATDVSIAQSGETWWEDYDLESVVAYYGYGGFGMVVRSSDFKGYAVSFSPVHRFDHLVGAAVQPCLVRAQGRDWSLMPNVALMRDALMVDQGTAATNPFITPAPSKEDYVAVDKGERMAVKRDVPLGLWRIRVSVEDRDLLERPHRVLIVRVTRLDAVRVNGQVTEFVDGPTWTSPEIAQPSAAAEVCARGRIGFFCQRKTVIGFTNVVVNKRGRAMIRIPAQWSSR